MDKVALGDHWFRTAGAQMFASLSDTLLGSLVLSEVGLTSAIPFVPPIRLVPDAHIVLTNNAIRMIGPNDLDEYIIERNFGHVTSTYRLNLQLVGNPLCIMHTSGLTRFSTVNATFDPDIDHADYHQHDAIISNNPLHIILQLKRALATASRRRTSAYLRHAKVVLVSSSHQDLIAIPTEHSRPCPRALVSSRWPMRLALRNLPSRWANVSNHTLCNQTFCVNMEAAETHSTDTTTVSICHHVRQHAVRFADAE